MPNQITQGFRLSPQQKHLWSLQKHSLVYFAQCALIIKGNLNREVLKAALEQVIIRHGILRTTFQYLPGMKIPVMVLGNNNILSWRDIDLSHEEPSELSSKIAYFFQETRSFTFKFEQGVSVACISSDAISK
jgi:hypothetical protein